MSICRVLTAAVRGVPSPALGTPASGAGLLCLAKVAARLTDVAPRDSDAGHVANGGAAGTEWVGPPWFVSAVVVSMTETLPPFVTCAPSMPCISSTSWLGKRSWWVDA